ncbi:MAG TPA: hypothetical protein GXX55_03555 [Firmicutes bacterium]|nr:hypothetical protein [Bacillota bacterium]
MAKLLKIEELEEISLVDRPAQEPALIRLAKRAETKEAESRAAAELAKKLAELETELGSLDLAVLKMEAAVEAARAARRPESVWEEIQSLARAIKRPDETREQAIERVLEENPELEKAYRTAQNPPTEARKRYAEALALAEIAPVVEALKAEDMDDREALMKAVEILPWWPDRARALEAAALEDVDKAARGHETRLALTRALVAAAKGRVNKAAGITLEAALAEEFSRPSARATLGG